MLIKEPTDADDKYVVFALIFMLSNRLQVIGDSFFKEVTTKQWFVMLILGMMNGYSPTLNELSEAVASSHQNVKQLVLKLEQKGFVALTKDSKDARMLRISLTPKSMDFEKSYNNKSQIFLDQLFANINKTDLSAARHVMSSLKDTLERMEKDYVTE